MADKQDLEKRAIDALTGGTVEVTDAFDGHEERLSPSGAKDVVNILKLADLKIVPVE